MVFILLNVSFFRLPDLGMVPVRDIIGRVAHNDVLRVVPCYSAMNVGFPFDV